MNLLTPKFTLLVFGFALVLYSCPALGQQGSNVGTQTTTSTSPQAASNVPPGTATASENIPPANAKPATPAPANAAGSTAAPAAASGPNSMQTIVVNATPPEENILPTSRPVNSVYGLDLNVMDTPRNVTVISREQLSQVDIQDARDYNKLTSDSYTESDFGTPAVPSIRGQPADVFVNGQRTGMNADGNGPPIDFNNIESVNIVKGPPDAISGTSVFVGGYVDEVTKRPYFDAFQGDAATTIGMYQQYSQTLDFGGPIIKDQLAYRVSYSGDESGSYYRFVHDNAQYGYAAATWIPSDKYTLDFNASFGVVDYLENNGINRVTQALIDNGSYITGQNPTVGVVSPQSGFFNTYTPTGTAGISRNTDIHNPGDGAYAKTVNAQAIQTLTPSDDLKIVNNTFYQYINWRTYNGQFYDQYSDGDYSVDNRLSAILSSDIPVIDPQKGSSNGPGIDPKDATPVASDPGLVFHNELNTGAEFRFQQNTDYQSIASEPFNIYDLTQNPNTIVNVIPPADYTAFGVAHIPGLPQKYVFDVDSDDDGKSELYETSFYAQDVLQFTKQWSLIFGGRADILHVDAETPPGTPAADYFSDSTTQILPDFNVSPTFKPFNWMTVYATLNRGQAPGNTAQDGGFSPELLSSSTFHQYATLYEFGSKFTLLKDKLYASATAYYEERYDPASDGGSYRQRVKGMEFEVNYQPDKHFYATASYSYAQSHDIDPGFQYNTIPDDKAGDGAGGIVADTPSFLTGGLTGTYKSPGFPDQDFNALAVYRWDNGFGVSADLQVTSPINVAWVGDVQIPWQYNVDMSAFYTYKNSEVKLSVYNVTDQKNWGSVNPIYGLDSIFAAEPVHLEGTLKIHF